MSEGEGSRAQCVAIEAHCERAMSQIAASSMLFVSLTAMNATVCAQRLCYTAVNAAAIAYNERNSGVALA